MHLGEGAELIFTHAHHQLNCSELQLGLQSEIHGNSSAQIYLMASFVHWTIATVCTDYSHRLNIKKNKCSSGQV